MKDLKKKEKMEATAQSGHDASGLLHPGWRRTSNNEEGEMTNGEE